jgi:hypothetical protein
MCEKWRNIVSLCIMDSNQQKDSLMLLETCVAAIDLPILQGFYVK